MHRCAVICSSARAVLRPRPRTHTRSVVVSPGDSRSSSRPGGNWSRNSAMDSTYGESAFASANPGSSLCLAGPRPGGEETYVGVCDAATSIGRQRCAVQLHTGGQIGYGEALTESMESRARHRFPPSRVRYAEVRLAVRVALTDRPTNEGDEWRGALEESMGLPTQE